MSKIVRKYRHRLLCGDCTVKENVDLLMGNSIVDLTFTSPPYNASKESFLNGKIKGFKDKYLSGGDDLNDSDYLNLILNSTKLAIDKSKFVFINLQMLAHNKFVLIEYQHQLKEFIKDILIWNKKICPPNICKGAFNTKWEYVFCFSTDNKTRGFPCEWQGKHPNVIETESNSSNEYADIHQAGFPVAFPLWIIQKMDFAKSVYDPFMGTGTTLIACEKTNRHCFGMEIDPHYCQVIIERYLKYTGKSDVYIINDGKRIAYSEL